MFFTLFVILSLLQSPEVPYRVKEDYQVELKYDLRTRSAAAPNTVNLDATGTQRPKTGMLPYLVVTVTILNVKEEEVRYRCLNNTGRTLFNRKLPKGSPFIIDMGYIDDIKDGLSSNQFTVNIVSVEKEPLNRIHLKIEKDGNFLVNGERRGKF